MSRRWISEELGMGDLSRVTSAVRRVNMGKEREIRRCKEQLEGISQIPGLIPFSLLFLSIRADFESRLRRTEGGGHCSAENL